MNSVHPTSWTLRKIKSKGLDLKSLRKVQDVKFTKLPKIPLKQEIESTDKYLGLDSEQVEIIEAVQRENEEVLQKFKNLSTNRSSCNKSEITKVEIKEFKIQEYSQKSLESFFVEKETLEAENPERNNTQRYSKFNEKKQEIIKKTDNTKQEILLKTTELQEWATLVLDQPEELIPDLIANVPDADRSTTVPIHETVDIGALDVLLNATKPTLFDSKPPIRLNVVQEVAPPETLVSNLQKTLGVTVSFKKSMNSKKKKEVVNRAKYGNWYIKPSLWSKKMKDSLKEKDSSKAQVKSLGLHEMIQKKLEEIKTNQEREDAEILAGNSLKPKKVF